MHYNEKKRKAKIEAAERKFLKIVAGYARKDQIRSTKIGEELSIFNLNDTIIKSRSQLKYQVQQIKDRRIPNKILTYNKNKNET
jgi:hypothetical protein